MKKIVFVVFLGIAIVYLFKIIKIVWSDYSRLTEYGIGYLSGSIVIFLLFSVLALLMFNKYLKKE